MLFASYCMMTSLAVLIEYQLVTDGQTDERTDRQTQGHSICRTGIVSCDDTRIDNSDIMLFIYSKMIGKLHLKVVRQLPCQCAICAGGAASGRKNKNCEHRTPHRRRDTKMLSIVYNGSRTWEGDTATNRLCRNVINH